VRSDDVTVGAQTLPTAGLVRHSNTWHTTYLWRWFTLRTSEVWRAVWYPYIKIPSRTASHSTCYGQRREKSLCHVVLFVLWHEILPLGFDFRMYS